jgi:predicted HicB family RNase H-like nuclease
MEDHKMTIRIPRELHKAAKVKAAESDVTLSEVVREFLRMWMAGQIELPSQAKEEEESQE